MGKHGILGFILVLCCLLGTSATWGQVKGAHSVNPDGSFSYQIPIAVPPGIRGVHPTLAFSYNSNAGNGQLGIGWSLQGLPIITRINYGSGVTYNGGDTYVGPAGLLHDVSGGAKTLFHSKYESWGRYVPSYSGCGAPANEPCSWVLTDKSGNKWHFGARADAFIEAPGKTAARVWALNKYEDTLGNSYTVFYEKFAAEGSYYPKRIEYTHSALGPGNRAIEFTTISRSSSPNPGYFTSADRAYFFEQGATVHVHRRLSKISIYAGAVGGSEADPGAEGSGILERVYEVKYDERDDAKYNGNVQVTRIERIEEKAGDGSLIRAFRVDWETAEGSWKDYASSNYSSNCFGTFAVANIFGDGKQSFYSCTTTQHRLQRFSPNTSVTASPSLVSGHTYPFFFVDLFGDGWPSLARLDPSEGSPSSVRFSRFNASNNTVTNNYLVASAVTRVADFAPGTGTASGLGFANMYGNGKQQLYQLGFHSAGEQSEYKLFTTNFNSNGTHTTRTVLIGYMPGNATIQSVLTSGHWAVVDLFGNGRPVLWWIGLGGEHRAMEINSDGSYTSWQWNSTATPASGYSGSWSFGDLFGEGRQLFYTSWGGGSTKHYALRFNRGNNSLTTYSYTGGSDTYGGTLGNFFGDGRMVSAKHTSGGTHYFTRFNADGTVQNFQFGSYGAPAFGTLGGLAADLVGAGYDQFYGPGGGNNFTVSFPSWFNKKVVQITNPEGGTVAVAFTPAPQMPGAVDAGNTTCLGGTGAGLNAPCGIPNQSTRGLTSSVTVDGGNPASPPTRYAYQYSNGRVTSVSSKHQTDDLGFQSMTTTNLDTGAYTVTQYNQAIPWTGAVKQVDHYLQGGVLLSQDTMTYREDGLATSIPYRPVPLSKTTNIYVRRNGTDVLAHVHSQLLDFDDFDNLDFQQKCTDSACVTSTREYLHDTTNWILDRLSWERVADAYNNNLSAIKNEYYDAGAPAGSQGQLQAKRVQLCEDATSCTGTDVNAIALMPIQQNVQYDQVGNLISFADSRGVVTSYAWDAVYRSFLASESQTVSNGPTLTLSFKYNSYGQPIEIKDRSEQTTNITYDRLGRKIREEAPFRSSFGARGRTQYSYEYFGQPTVQYVSVRRYDGSNTSEERSYIDGLGFQYKKVRPGDGDDVVQEWRREYPQDGTVVTTEFRPGYGQANMAAFTRVTADGAGRILTKLIPATPSAGNPARTLNVTITREGCDVLPGFRSIKTISQEGSLPVPQVCEYLDGFNNLRRKEVSPGLAQAAYVTQYTYDSANRIRNVLLPNVQQIDVTYDSWGRRKSIDDPSIGQPGLRGTNTFDYDDSTGTVTLVDNSLRVTRMEFDALKRLTHKYTDYGEAGQSLVQYFYDGAMANGKGRLTRVEDSSGTTEFAYDESGNATHRAVTLNGISGPYVETRDYDLQNRLKTVTHPDDHAVQYDYNANGMLHSVSYEGKLVARYTSYTADNSVGVRTTNPTFDYATVTEYTYDSSTGLLDEMEVTGRNASQAPVNLARLAYDFDVFGNVTRITDQKDGGGLDGWSFSYDALHRLSQARALDANGNDYEVQTNSFNSVGHLLAMGDSRTFFYSGMQLTAGTDTSQAGTLANLTAGYDSKGNMISKATDPGTPSELAFTYDAENRLKQVTKNGSGLLDFTYNYAGERAKKVSTFAGQQGAGTWTTYYVTRNFVLRQNAGATGHKRTIHISAPGIGRIASITEIYTQSVADLGRQGYLVYAGMFDVATPTGLANRAYYTAVGLANKPNMERHLLLGILLAATAALAILGMVAVLRRKARAPNLPVELRLASLGLALVLVVVGCGGGAGNGKKGGGMRGEVSEVIPPKYNPMYELPYYEPLEVLQVWCTDGLESTPCYPDDGQQPGTWFYHSNHIGSTTLVTDAHGQEAMRMRYQPYGEIREVVPATFTIPVAHTYTGQEYDSETGLLNYRARMYDPTLGRFLTPDTIVDGGGLEPQGFNRYAYTRFNPINYSDPSGNSWVSKQLGFDKCGNCGDISAGWHEEWKRWDWKAKWDSMWGDAKRTWDTNNRYWQWEPRYQQFTHGMENPDKQAWHNVVDAIILVATIVVLMYVCGTTGVTCAVLTEAAAGFVEGYAHARVEGASVADAFYTGVYGAALGAAMAGAQQYGHANPTSVANSVPGSTDIGKDAYKKALEKLTIGPSTTAFLDVAKFAGKRAALTAAKRHLLPEYVPKWIDEMDGEDLDSQQDVRNTGVYRNAVPFVD